MRTIAVLSLIIFSFAFGNCNKHDSPTTDPVNSLNNGLIAYYPFNGNANDESGNHYNSSVTRATLVADRFGNASQAYSFNGTNSYIDVPKLLKADSTQDFSISIWVKTFTVNGSSGMIISFQNSSNGFCCNNYSVQFYANKPITFQSLISKQTSQSCVNTELIDSFPSVAGTWNHLVFVRHLDVSITPITLKFYQYLNGIKSEKSAGTFDPASIILVAASFSHGSTFGSNRNDFGYYDFFYGMLDDIRIYNRVLTAEEALKLYNLH